MIFFSKLGTYDIVAACFDIFVFDGPFKYYESVSTNDTVIFIL